MSLKAKIEGAKEEENKVSGHAQEQKSPLCW